MTSDSQGASPPPATHPFAAKLRPWTIAAAALAWSTLLFRFVPILPAVACALLLTLLAGFLQKYSARQGGKASFATRIGTAALLSGAILSSLLLVEIGARLLAVDEPPSNEFFEYHPEYLFLIRPNVEYLAPIPVGPEEKKIVEVNSSSIGLRDREYGPKEPDEFRILMLGDSFTLGHGVNIEHSIPRVVEQMLNERAGDRRITVINGGISGGGVWQHIGMWRTRGKDLEPDLVVLQLFPDNDFDGSLESVGKHLRAYDPGWKRVLQSFQLAKIPYYRLELWFVEQSTAYRIVKRNTSFYPWIAHALNSIRVLPHYEIPEMPPSENRLSLLEPHLQDWYPELHEALDLMRQQVRILRDEVSATGAPFVAYTLPSMDVVDDDRWQHWAVEKTPGVEYERGKGLRVVNEMLTEEGIPNLSLYDDLRGYEDEEIFLTLDGHYNEFGYYLVSKRVAEFLWSLFGETMNAG